MPFECSFPVRAQRAVLLLSLLFLTTAIGFSPFPARGALVRQAEGSGQFHSYIDVVNRWTTEDRLDVLVVVEVVNAELGFREEAGKLVGRVNLEVELRGPDGQTVKRTNRVRTVPMSPEEAGSTTLSQVFGVVLDDVPFRNGRMRCEVVDVTRQREGALNRYWRAEYFSETVMDWFADDQPRPERGLAVEDPLFLAHAPMGVWNPDNVASESRSSDWLQDYVHPSRRYGIEQESLQLAFPVWPQAGGLEADAGVRGLVVQIFNPAMTYVLTDTIDLDRRGRAALEAGRPAWIFYEVDVNRLPDGSYQMSLAPLGGQGRGLLVGFDVNWRIEGLGRHRDLVLGEGAVLFRGEKLERFRNASLVEQEKMLEMFWAENDPEPDSPLNSSYLEFQSRLAYVRSFLGGFGPDGPLDDRGLVHLLLGPPTEIQRKHMPADSQEQDDARVKVFERFAPDREGVMTRSTVPMNELEIYDRGSIPMPYSRQAEIERQAQQGSPSRDYGFELWKYDMGGRVLFPNRFSMGSMGARFLFVDRSGAGQFILESSNQIRGD